MAKSKFCDFVKIPVMLCCNNDRGNFDGNLRSIHLDEAMELECDTWDDDEGDWDGLRFEEKGHKLIFGNEAFEFIDSIEWCGNMCWNLYWMYAKDFFSFIKFIHSQKRYSVVEAESRLFQDWESTKEIPDSALQLFVKYTSSFRL